MRASVHPLSNQFVHAETQRQSHRYTRANIHTSRGQHEPENVDRARAKRDTNAKLTRCDRKLFHAGAIAIE